VASLPSNLGVRLLTVGVLGPLLLLLLFAGPVWGWALLISLSAAQAAYELFAMTHPTDRPSRLVGAGLTGILTACTFLGWEDARIFFSGVLGVVVAMVLLPLLRLGQIETAALRLLGGVAGAVYVGLTMGCLALLRVEPAGGSWWVFLTLTIAWMGDTGGYTFGRLWGRRKLYEAVSPKKTVEGLLGSVVFSTGSAVGASLTYLPQLPLVHGLVLGAVGALLGQAGDLAESLIKRSTGVKDSGSILPGHGGLFDRIDALLVVAGLVYWYRLWFG
jgi:phosphatidate cytidylyltransferase